MTYRITYADGQTFQVDLPKAAEVKHFLRTDYPKAVFDEGEGGRITAWEDRAALRAHEKPVAVVEKVGTVRRKKR